MPEKTTQNENIEWEVLNPEAEYEARVKATASRLDGLNGHKIGLFWNGKPGGDVFLREVAAQLKERFSNAEFIELHSSQGLRPPEEIEQMAKKCHAIISGVGD